MSFFETLKGVDLLITRRELPATQASRPRAVAKTSAVGTVGAILLGLIVLSIVFYSIDQSTEGRLVLDLAVLFLGWATGRATGEIAGVSRSAE